MTTISVKFRVSNRSAGLISRIHYDENSVESEVFETVNCNLNEEACGDMPHPMPITVSSNPALTVTATVENETVYSWKLPN